MQPTLHVIDRVINQPKLQQGLFKTPKGLEFIDYHSYYPSLRGKDGGNTFSYLINQTDHRSMFDYSAYIFFVPNTIDEKFQNFMNPNVLLSHIIQDKVLFLRSMNESMPYKTRVNSDELFLGVKVEIAKGEVASVIEATPEVAN